MKKQLLVLLAGISLVSGTAFAGELTSFTHEGVFNEVDGGSKQLEWTVGKGTYKINDKFSFGFDVDKDYITTATGVKKEGWDSTFKLIQNVGKVGNWDLSLNYRIDLDDRWLATTGAKDGYDNQVIYMVNPSFSKDVTVLAKPFSLAVDLFGKVGKQDGKSIKSLSDAEIDFDLAGDLTKNTSLESTLGAYYTYNDGSKKYENSLDTEHILTFSVPLRENLSFKVENDIYFLYNGTTEYTEFDAYVKPIVKYTKAIDSHLSVYGGVGYKAYNYSYSKNKGEEASKSWGGSELETTLGFKIK